MEYNLYPIDELLTQATIEQIKNSLTIRNGNAYIRLFNSREHWATVPAVFPNILHIRKKFNGFDNIRPHRYDYIEGKQSGNRKTELVVQQPIVELQKLGLDFLSLVEASIDDNNTTTL